MFRTHTVRHVLSIAIVALGLPASVAVATDLPPGGVIALSGASRGSATPVRDVLIPFTIQDSFGNTLFSGNVQDRVAEIDATGTLSFEKYIRDTSPNANGVVASFSVDGFESVSTNVEWYDGLGSRAPDQATRSGDGDVLSYFFNDEPIFAGQGSEFCYAVTEAEQFAVTGSMTITLQSGHSTTINVAVPVIDDSPPEAQINMPDPDACVCGLVDVAGIADDPDGTYDSDMLEYRALTDTSWTLIGSSTSPTPAPGGVLYTWDTTGLAEGRYLLRLTVTNTVGLTSSAVTTVWVNAQFDVFDYNGPGTGAVVGGNVCPRGTINNFNADCADKFSIEFAPAGSGSFMHIDPGTPVYTGSRINQTFAVWDSTVVADGEYDLRVTAFDDCGHELSETHTVTVDNTPPTAVIETPVNCQKFDVDTTITVTGVISDANLAGWSLQYAGGTTHSWTTIASGNVNVDGVIAEWDTSGLDPCCYVLRLVVSDEATVNCNGALENRSVYVTTVNLGDCPADFDGNGVVDVFDLFQLLNAWGSCT